MGFFNTDENQAIIIKNIKNWDTKDYKRKKYPPSYPMELRTLY